MQAPDKYAKSGYSEYLKKNNYSKLII